MLIRKMTADDVEAVYKLSCQCFSQPWSREAIEKEVSNPLADYFVAVQEDEVIGYAGMWHMLDEGEVINIAVSAAARRQQAGSKLMEALLKEAEARKLSVVFLEVRTSNHAAQALYQKYGFSEIGRRKNYYHEPTEDAVNMSCILKD